MRLRSISIKNGERFDDEYEMYLSDDVIKGKISECSGSNLMYGMLKRLL